MDRDQTYKGRQTIDMPMSETAQLWRQAVIRRGQARHEFLSRIMPKSVVRQHESRGR